MKCTECDIKGNCEREINEWGHISTGSLDECAIPKRRNFTAIESREQNIKACRTFIKSLPDLLCSAIDNAIYLELTTDEVDYLVRAKNLLVAFRG